MSLLNTTSGYRRFSSVMSSGDTCYYCLECPSNGDWECGLGTYSSNNALSRTTVYSSSNSGAIVNFANRVSYAFISYVASRAIYLDPSGELNLALSALNDVSLTAPSSGQILSFTGSEWVNGPVPGSYSDEEAQDAVGGILTDTSSISFSYNDGTPSISASVKNSGVTNDMLATGIDATKLGSGSVSSTELGYLDGVTSSLQVQLDSKYASANPSGYLTASVASATYQPLDADLTSLASASGSGIYERSGGSWTPVVIGTGLSLGSGTLSNTLDLSSYLTSSVATATYLPLTGGTLTGDLKFTDATYDIGKSGATRPRDGFFSRNLTVGASIYVPAYGSSGTPILSWGGGDFGLYAATFGVAFKAYGAAAAVAALNSGLIVTSGSTICWSSTSSVDGTRDVCLWRGGADILDLQRGTNAQTFRLAETWTSSTSFGALQVKANTGAAYQIGSAIGSAGGTNRAITFGHWNAAGTFTASLSAAADGSLTFLGSYSLVSNNYNLQLTNSPSAAFAGTAFGFSASAGHSNTVAIGTNSTTTAAGQCVIGGNAAGITSVFIGNGVTHGTPNNIVYNATGGSGANTAGASLALAGGKSTGSANGGSVKVQVSPAGSSGSTLNTLVDAVVIDSNKNSTFYGTISSPSLTPLLLLQIWG